MVIVVVMGHSHGHGYWLSMIVWSSSHSHWLRGHGYRVMESWVHNNWVMESCEYGYGIMSHLVMGSWGHEASLYFWSFGYRDKWSLGHSHGVIGSWSLSHGDRVMVTKSHGLSHGDGVTGPHSW